MKMDEHLRNFIPQLEVEWGTRPRCVLANQGSADEHWQIFNPYDVGMAQLPRYVVDDEGVDKVEIS